MSERLLNMTAIKDHALKCSKETRNGKFDRVSQTFLDLVEADIETIVRGLGNACPVQDGVRPVAIDAHNVFVTGAMADKLGILVHEAIARLIQRRVHRHPTVGKTLMG